MITTLTQYNLAHFVAIFVQHATIVDAPMEWYETNFDIQLHELHYDINFEFYQILRYQFSPHFHIYPLVDYM